MGISGMSTGSDGYGGYFRAFGTNGTGITGEHTPSGNTGSLGGDTYAVKAEGDLIVSGAYKGNISSSSGSDGAPFPRPAYDSRWVSMDRPDGKTLTHNIGGSTDNYFVDIQFKDSSLGINIIDLGGDKYGDWTMQGAHWEGLASTQITIWRDIDDIGAEQIRIRIWVYN